MASRPRHTAVVPGPSPGRTPARANGVHASPSTGDARGGEAREVEWQLTAPDLGAVGRWLDRHAHLDDLSIEPLPAQQLHDTYLDTEDWRLFRAGFALRLRDKKKGHAEATLKGLRSAREDVADRREITEPLPEGRAKALAHAIGPVGGRVRDVVGVKPLRTLFEVRTSRQRFAVRSRNPAATVGEIALDEARFSRGNGHRRPMVLTRVELEATGPDAAALEGLAERLRAECGLHPARENKFAVGLRSASLEPPRGAMPDLQAAPAPAVMNGATRASDFAATSLQRLLREWQATEPAARLGESPEPLHKLRVTARRIDTVLSLFRGFLPAGVVRNRPKLKALLDAVGEVRDVDIRLDAVRTFRSDLVESERPALGPLLRHLESERAQARSRMLRALDAKTTREWLDTLPNQLSRTAPPIQSASSRDATALTVLPGLIRKRYRKLRKCARRLTPESSLPEFHEVRVRAKKLRYALEVVAPTYGKPTDKMLSALHKLQSRLGTQHDADVISRYLTQLATRAPVDFTAATLFMLGRLAERYTREAVRLGRKIEKPWRRVRGSRWQAMRSRMKELRGDTPGNDIDDARAGHGSSGNRKFAGANGGWTFPDSRGH
ncbi:MAG: CHAD domain-containing protein [Gammaproteobacteria bacterium]|nr:CHAD domain-containing protein [Gammaproteobacteria bacterium]